MTSSSEPVSALRDLLARNAEGEFIEPATTEERIIAWLESDENNVLTLVKLAGDAVRDLRRLRHEETINTIDQPKAEVDRGMHQRGWDLLRFMRGELLENGLISLREYAWLVSESPAASKIVGAGSPSPRRLESYDAIKARLDSFDAMEQTLDRLAQLTEAQAEEIARLKEGK